MWDSVFSMGGVALLILAIFLVVLHPVISPSPVVRNSMRWRLRWLLALFRFRNFILIVLSVLALSSVASARRHHVRHDRVSHHVAARIQQEPGWLWGTFSLFPGAGASSDVVSEARRYMGATGDAFGRSTLWCARFMNVVLARTGHQGTGSDAARSFESFPHINGPQVGAIAVLRRKGGGHVGVVSAVTANGDPVLISGNSGRRVREGVYPSSRVVAYVRPR